MDEIRPVRPPLIVHSGVHRPELDGLRGLAVALVMAHHFTIYGGMRPAVAIDRVYYQVAQSGWWGVDLFFVLSGFLITGVLVDAKGGAGYFRRFYVRRVLRIAPLYYGVLIVIFWILPNTMSAPTGFEEDLRNQGWYWSYLANIQIARDGWPQSPGLGHFWSLAVEEQFYLVWPAVVWFVGRRTLLRLCGVIVVTGILVRAGCATAHEPLAAYVLVPARMDSLAVGAFLAVTAREAGAWAMVRRWAPAVGWAAAAILVLLFVQKGKLDTESVQVYTLGFTLVAAMSGSLLVAAIACRPGHPIRRIFEGRALRFLGRYSYALYVFHNILVRRMASHGLSVDILPRVAGSQLPGQLLFLVTAAGASLVLALLSWHAIEQPALELKRFFPYDSRPTRPPAGHLTVTEQR